MPSTTITPTNSMYIVLCPFSINFTIILNSDNSCLISVSITIIYLSISFSWLTHFKNLSQSKHFMYSLPEFWLECDTFLTPCIWHLGHISSSSFSSRLLEEEVPLISTVHPILGNKLLGNKEDEHSQIHLNTAVARVEAKVLRKEEEQWWINLHH